MRIGVLTSSRADFGIYMPLIEKLKQDSSIQLKIIAFGTHCSVFHGRTVQEIEDAGFNDIDTISTVLASDDEESITTSYGLTVIKFADYWSSNKYDLVFCLGDRYEMSAAVQAGVPFRITFAHLHGGEKTLGAIDNIYRHQITHASQMHFTASNEYTEKVKSLIDSDKHIHNVGALTLDGLDKAELVDEREFRNQYEISEGEFILTTFHPETVEVEKNVKYAKEMAEAIKELSDEFIFVITMPNADTLGSIFRKSIQELKAKLPRRIVAVENFGKKNYFSAMEYASFLLGNTSSGITEAASFGKYVVNVGNRQKGRVQSDNVINCVFEKDAILKSVLKAKERDEFKGKNIYRKKNTAEKIINAIKTYYETL